MAIDFSGISNDYLQMSSMFGVSAYPYTLACWAKRDSSGTGGVLVSTTSGPSEDGNYLQYGSTTADAASNDYGVTAPADSLSTNDTSWHNIVGVFNSASDRKVYVDGTAGSGNTTSITVTPWPTQLSIGCYGTNNFLGTASVMQAAMWDIALTAADIAQLAKGFSPRRVRPANLRCYVPMIREEKELMSRPGFATASANYAPHHRVYGM